MYDKIFYILVIIACYAAFFAAMAIVWRYGLATIIESARDVMGRFINGPEKHYDCVAMHHAAVYEKEIYGRVRSVDILTHLEKDNCPLTIQSGQEDWWLEAKAYGRPTLYFQSTGDSGKYIQPVVGPDEYIYPVVDRLKNLMEEKKRIMSEGGKVWPSEQVTQGTGTSATDSQPES